MKQEIRKLRMSALLAVIFLFLSLMFVTAPVAAKLPYYILPEASFTYEPTSPVACQMITFDGSSSTADPHLFIKKYEWDFGDGSFGSGEYFEMHYPSAGTYIVTLTVWDKIGAKGSESETISVGPWYPWPMFHHDAQRTGVATANGIFTTIVTKKWDYPTGDKIVSSPAVSKNGIIYFGSWDMHLYALDHDGNPVPGSWPFSTSPAKVSSSPAIAEEGPEEGTIYVGTHDNVATRDNFFAINPDGTKKWGLCLSDHVPGDWIGTSSAAITYEAGGMPVIYIASTAGYLYRIEDQGTTGVIPAPWPVQLSSPLCPLLQSPAISPDGQTIYIGTGFPWPTCPEIGTLVAIDRLGNIRWSETLATAPGECVSSPSVEIVDGILTIYAGTSDHRMCAVQDLGGSNHQIKWIYTDNLQLGGVASCPAIYDLNWDGKVEIIFGSGNKYVYAVSDFGVNDPRLYWKFQTADEVASSPAIALAPQPTVFIGSKDNKIYSINWNETTWSSWGVASYTTGGDVVSSPAVTQPETTGVGVPGWVFIGSDDGKLYAFGLRAKYAINETEYLNMIPRPVDVSKIRYKFTAVDEEWAAKWTNLLLYGQKETKYSIEIRLNKAGYVTRVDFERWGFPITEIPYDLAKQSLESLPPGFAIP